MKQKFILRPKAKNLDPILRIGKNGLTENGINELNKLLRKRKLIKIKLLKAAMKGKNKKELISGITEKTNSELIEAVGNIVVLHRK